MSKKLYCVYMHTNKINGKKYVGITYQDPIKRWNYGHGYCNNQHFYSAIKKYGWNNFEHTIIADNLMVKDACLLERELIALHKSANPDFGYNICEGGQTNILPRSSLDKISKANKGRKMTKEVMERRSLNPPKANRVICDGVLFISIAECAKHYGVSQRLMRGWLDGRYYVPDKFVDARLHYESTPCLYKQIYAKRKWVLCDDIEFPSVVACAKYLEIEVSELRDILNGKKSMSEDLQSRNLHTFSKKVYISQMTSPRSMKQN